MTDLEVLDRHCVEIARDLREPGLLLDTDPDAITKCLHLPAVELNQAMFIPPEHTDRTYKVDGRAFPDGSCRSGVVMMDRLAYGDPGVLLAAPGPSLSGLAVNAVGDAEQRGRYFERFAKEPTWTFFALTEHGKGSAALELQTRLRPAEPAGYTLDGDKRYIGNGASAQVGVVFCRRAPGPFGVEAVLIDTAAPGFIGRRLPTVGLAGVRIGELAFRGMRVTPEMILGADRRPSRRGLLGVRETMLRYRPLLTAMAVGVTDVVVDYIRAQRQQLSTHDRTRLDDLAGRVHLARARVREVAAAVDAGQPDLPRISSAKLTAVRLAEEATLLAVDLLGPAALLEHPWLAKTYRDVRAFEFMDGAGDIHRLLVFQGLLRQTRE